MKNKKLWIGIIVVLLIVVFAGVALSKKKPTEDKIGGFKNGPRVKVEVVKKDDIQTKISSSGELEAKDTKTIYAETNNKVVKIHKKVGDTVKKGEVILTLDTEIAQKTEKSIESLELKLKASQEGLNQLLSGGSRQEILAAQSACVQAQKNVQDARDLLDTQKTNLENYQRDLKTQKTQYEVQLELFNSGLLAKKELDDEKNNLTDLQQKVESTQTAISSAQKAIESASIQSQKAEYDLSVLLNKVEDTTKRQSIAAKQSEVKEIQTQIFNSQTDLKKSSAQVIAPIDGVIIEIPDQEGMPVTPGMVLAKIVDPSKLLINCDISPYYAADLKVGLDAKIKYTGSKTIEVDGKVTKVSPVALEKQSADKSSKSTSIPVEVEVAQPGDVIKPGFSVDVKIITDTREGVCIIPILSTVEDDDNSTYVYVVKEDGSLEKRVVTQGLNNGLNTEVDNLKDGELVVANPTEFLHEGMKVSYEKPGDLK